VDLADALPRVDQAWSGLVFVDVVRLLVGGWGAVVLVIGAVAQRRLGPTIWPNTR
jgi:hypothetical protein